MSGNTKWLDSVVVITEPIPHIPEKEIIKLMPHELREQWEDFIRGQTGLHCENGDFGVYAWDWERFASKVHNEQKDLQDTTEEWD